MPQLGVNSDSAIRNGALANKPQFFGDATAEVASANSGIGSGWNSDWSGSVTAGAPWATRSGQPSNGANIGIFAYDDYPGGVAATVGHRTILSGY